MKNILILLFLFTGIFANAQQQTSRDSIPPAWEFKGKVTEGSKYTPLAGAHIINLNTVTGSISDEQGNFLIPVSEKDTLLVSFLGYNSKKIIIKDKTNYDDIQIIVLYEKFTELEQVDLDVKLTGVLSVDTKNAPGLTNNHVHLNGLPQTFETGKPKSRTYDKPFDLVFHPVDFIYEMFGKKPKQLRKLKKLKKEDLLRDMLEKKANREILMEYLDINKEQLNRLLDYCHYSEYFIKNATDLQVIDAVLECYENYKALKAGKLQQNGE